MLNVWIGNLGKYNEGELIGKWITFPITKQELDKALKEIGINENYEEWFFTDFDGKYPCCVSNLLCEYSSVSSLNQIALALDKVAKAGTGEEFEGFLETKDDFFGACANAIAGNGVYINCGDYSELAHFYVDEMGGAENLPQAIQVISLSIFYKEPQRDAIFLVVFFFSLFASQYLIPQHLTIIKVKVVVCGFRTIEHRIQQLEQRSLARIVLTNNQRQILLQINREVLQKTVVSDCYFANMHIVLIIDCRMELLSVLIRETGSADP